MEFYFKPINNEGYITNYPRADLELEKRPLVEGQWYIVETEQRPADGLLYDITELPLVLTGNPSPLALDKPHFRRAIRRWRRTRKTTEEINAIIDADEERQEQDLLRRATAGAIRTDNVVITVALALVNASTLSANAKQNATSALNARKTANDSIYNALEAIKTQTENRKTRAAQGEDVL